MSNTALMIKFEHKGKGVFQRDANITERIVYMIDDFSPETLKYDFDRYAADVTHIMKYLRKNPGNITLNEEMPDYRSREMLYIRYDADAGLYAINNRMTNERIYAKRNAALQCLIDVYRDLSRRKNGTDVLTEEKTA